MVAIRLCGYVGSILLLHQRGFLAVCRHGVVYFFTEDGEVRCRRIVLCGYYVYYKRPAHAARMPISSPSPGPLTLDPCLAYLLLSPISVDLSCERRTILTIASCEAAPRFSTRIPYFTTFYPFAVVHCIVPVFPPIFAQYYLPFD